MLRPTLFQLILVAALCTATLAQPSVDTILITDTLETPEWFLSENRPAPSSATIQVLIDSIIPVHTREDYSYLETNGNLEWTIDTIGKLGGYTVIDLMGTLLFRDWEDKSKWTPVIAVKAMALEIVPQRYRLVYMAGAEPGNVYFTSSFMTLHQGIAILGTDCMMSGTGSFHVEAYWIWNAEKKVPIRLTLGSTSGRALKRLLPPGHGIWKGGGPDIHTLFLKSLTWQDGDGNCCPSGGTVSIQLGLDSTGPYVKWGKFDYSELEERVAYTVYETGDSSYVKNPPRTIDSTDLPRETLREMSCFNSSSQSYSIPPRYSSIDSVVNVYVRSAIRSTIYDNPETTPFRWVLDTVGSVSGFDLIEVAFSFTCGRCRDTSGKVIVLQRASDQYDVLYLGEFMENRSTAGINSISSISSDTIIYVKGNSNFVSTYIDNYWRWDSEKQEPVSLFQQWVVDETVTLIAPRYLPDDTYILPHKGRWDANAMTYETPVWKRSDAPKQPTGGSASFTFDLLNHRLQPVSMVYSVSSK